MIFDYRPARLVSYSIGGALIKRGTIIFPSSQGGSPVATYDTSNAAPVSLGSVLGEAYDALPLKAKYPFKKSLVEILSQGDYKGELDHLLCDEKVKEGVRIPA